MDFKRFYATGASQYQELVAAEDADGNLGPVLNSEIDAGASVLEIGAGTGRVTRILQAIGVAVVATEPVDGMLAEAVRIAPGDENCHFVRAEAACLPFSGGSFDTAVAGWVFGHQLEWRPDDWREVITGFLDECDRVTGGGTVILIETLGTGHDTPSPPEGLDHLYSWLEGTRGFQRRWVRTDYVFESVETAARAAGSFFGEDFAAQIRAREWARIPECTGIWTRRPHVGRHARVSRPDLDETQG